MVVASLIVIGLGRRTEIAEMALAEEQNLKLAEAQGDMMEWSVKA